MNITYGTIESSRLAIINHILQQRKDYPRYRVIDLGGVAGGSWSSPYIDMCVDINAGNSESSLSLDLCRPDSWQPLWDIIALHGVYDFAICNHTLEDLYNPFPVLDLLPRIALRGMITTPSIRTELSHLPESPQFRGYVHHRWLFDQANSNAMWIAPKLGCLEREDSIVSDYHLGQQEIQYEWEGHIPYGLIQGNYFTSTGDYMHLVSSQLAQAHSRLS